MKKNQNMPLDDFRFDRLVDGELSEEDRRELLAGLDDEVGGWRRCALAFLEAQCWKQSLGELRRDRTKSAGFPGEQKNKQEDSCLSRWEATGTRAVSSEKPVSQESVAQNALAPSPSSRARGVTMKTLLAMAACFLVAFWVGSLVHSRRIEPSPMAGDTTAQIATRKTPAPARMEQPIPPQRGLANASPQGKTISPWRVVTVGSPGNAANGVSPLRLPAVERETIDPQWLQNLPSAVPGDVVQALDRSGHQVRQQRELVPVRLQDGRQMVVPVDQVDVHYVGNGPY